MIKWIRNIFRKKQTQTPTPVAPKDTPIFVYGTLRTGQGNYNWSFKNNLAQRAEAQAPGFVLEFVYPHGGYPVMRPAGNNSVVTGELMWLDDTNDARRILHSVDAMERGAGYTKKLIDVFYYNLVDKQPTKIQAWAYVMEDGKRRTEMLIKSGDWLKRFKE